MITSPQPPRAAIVEDALQRIAEGQRIRVVYVDIPKWARRMLGEPRLSLQHLEYMLWQIAALRVARRLHKEQAFDVVWHLTWANVWIGSFACFLGPPLVFGPVGGGVGTPWRLAPVLGFRGAAFDIVRAVTRKLARHLNPLGRFTWERAQLILVQNPETREWLPRRHHAKTVVFPNAVLEELPAPTQRQPRHKPPIALFAGRLLPLKGVSLALRTISQLPEWHLLICGTGPDEGRLRRLARELGVDSRIEFLGWRAREELLHLMREEVDVFLFPSLHDEGSWVVAEALAYHLPVVCLDRGGPAVLAGGGVAATTLDATVLALAEAVRTAEYRPAAVLPTDLDSSRARLADLLRRVGLLGTDDEARIRNGT